MQLSENGWKFLEQNEGTVLHPYLDSTGKPTIGIGSTFYPDGSPVTMSDPDITMEQAQAIASSAVANIFLGLSSVLPTSLNQNQIDSILDFCYNLGFGAFRGSTLFRLITANHADPAIRAAFLMWDKEHVDGQLVFSQDLADRRAREADLYFSS
jgi:lysozyme